MWPILIGAILLTYVGCDQNKNIIYDDECYPSETTVSGTYAPSCTFCSGSLIFAEEFDEFNLQTWEHIFDPNKEGFYTLVNSRRNSFTEDGVLFLRPSISSDQCATCKTNPVVTAAIRTTKSFSFRYGRVEIRAKLPAGDWLTPALWLLPASSVQYGPWPSSGHISIMQSRGNRILLHNGKNIGIQSANAGLSYGISQQSALIQNQFSRINESGYDRDFHLYQIEWTPDSIKFSVDDVEIGKIDPGADGFWKYGKFDSNSRNLNPWRSGSKMAPFDQQFYLEIDLTMGGINGNFPDDVQNPTPKPWSNSSPNAGADFWKGRDSWLPTWGLDRNDGRDASFQIDYIRVWAL